MYPSPSSLYNPPVTQQTSQFIPPTSASSSYPHPQYNYSANSAAAAHPGQPPLNPQSMPYGTSGNTTNQQNLNNLNGPLSVSNRNTIKSFT